MNESGSGCVMRFNVDFAYLERFPVQVVSGSTHAELWIPAEELSDFNSHIVGKSEVIESFTRKTTWMYFKYSDLLMHNISTITIFI